MIKKRNGFTLVEVLLYIILTTILVVAGSDAFRSISDNARQVYTMLSHRTNWLFAYRHIAYKVHTSSYVVVANPGDPNSTLTLFDYNHVNIGTYSNSEDGLTFSGGASFPGVSVIFKPGEEKLGKIIEAITKFTAPFVTTAYFKCGCDVPPPNTWAIYLSSELEETLYGWVQAAFMNKIFQVIDIFGNDDGYILTDSWMCFFKLNKVGEKRSSLLTKFSNNVISRMTDCKPTFNDSLQLDGYVMTGFGLTVDALGDMIDKYIVLAKFDIDGNMVWSRGYKTTASMTYNFASCVVVQVFNALGMPDGYLIAGNNYSPTGLTWDDGYLIRTADNGDSQWTKVLTTSDIDYYFDIKQIYSPSTGMDGYIMGGVSLGASIAPKLIKLTNNGAVEWVKKLTFTSGTFNNGVVVVGSSMPPCSHGITFYQTSGMVNVKFSGSIPYYQYICGNYIAEFDSSGGLLSSSLYSCGTGAFINATFHSANPASNNGYLIGGKANRFPPAPPGEKLNTAFCFLKDADGIKWAKYFNNNDEMFGDRMVDMREIYDGGVTDGYVGYAEPYLVVKTDADGNCPQVLVPENIRVTDTAFATAALGTIEPNFTSNPVLVVPAATPTSPAQVVVNLDPMGEP